MFSYKDYLYNLVTGKITGIGATLLRGGLFIFSLIYGLGVAMLSAIYSIKPRRFSAKVISVGNITLGGTGKTTLVEYLANKLILVGHKVAVLTRGYKRDMAGRGARGLGDEPTMLAKHLPLAQVLVDKNRITSAQKAIKDYAADTLLLDDGLQQWKIFKDLEIIAIDAGNPFGNGRMLPAGFLREPLAALKRADIFVLTQVAPGQQLNSFMDRLKSINPGALIVESVHQPQGFFRLDQPDERLSRESLKGKTAAIFSGIGNPQGFSSLISALGIKVAKDYKFADHYDYTLADIARIVKEAKENKIEAIITTPKDAVKITQLGAKETGILVLEIKLEITKNEAEFNRRLLKLYNI